MMVQKDQEELEAKKQLEHFRFPSYLTHLAEKLKENESLQRDINNLLDDMDKNNNEIRTIILELQMKEFKDVHPKMASILFKDYKSEYIKIIK